jgi:hypothetical protein
MGYVGWIGNFQGLKGTGKERNFESELVKELRKMGAILFCKTSVPHTLMCGETVNNIIGYTWNPKNRNLSSGGSSGGEGALIGLRGSCAGFGTDIGESFQVNLIKTIANNPTRRLDQNPSSLQRPLRPATFSRSSSLRRNGKQLRRTRQHPLRRRTSCHHSRRPQVLDSSPSKHLAMAPRSSRARDPLAPNSRTRHLRPSHSCRNASVLRGPKPRWQLCSTPTRRPRPENGRRHPASQRPHRH